MASMKGCDKPYYGKLKAQGVNTITPGKFARNNLSMGGVNDYLGGSERDERSNSSDKKGRVGAGSASQSKYSDMPKGK